MSAHAFREEKEKVYKDDEHLDFGEFGIIEKTDESHGYTKEEIISLLELLAEELRTTSKSEYRNAVLESLTRPEEPDYAAAFVECINYRLSWHFKGSKKTRIISDIYGLLQQLQKVAPSEFESKVEAMDDSVIDDAKVDDSVIDDAKADDSVIDDAKADDSVIDDAKAFEEPFNSNIKIVGNAIVRADNKNTVVPFKQIYETPALMKKLLELFRNFEEKYKNWHTKNVATFTFTGESGEETLEIKVDRATIPGLTLSTLMMYPENRTAFLEALNKKFGPNPSAPSQSNPAATTTTTTTTTTEFRQDGDDD